MRLALEARARERWAPRAALVDEVFRGVRPQLPPPVARALTELAEARAAARREPASSAPAAADREPASSPPPAAPHEPATAIL